MAMSEARKAGIKPELGLAMIDIWYAAQAARDAASDMADETKILKKYVRKVELHLKKAEARYKEIYGKDWTRPKK